MSEFLRLDGDALVAGERARETSAKSEPPPRGLPYTRHLHISSLSLALPGSRSSLQSALNLLLPPLPLPLASLLVP